jgi:hypothetical protein
MDEIVELTEKDFYPPDPIDKLLLVEVGDIFDEMNQAIYFSGEQPVADPYKNGNNTDAFLMDIFHQVGYLPNGSRVIAPNIAEVLDSCGQYFDVYHMSVLQRQLWIQATQRLVDRFCEYRLYDKTHIHRYDYYQLRGDTLVLKLFE